MAISTQPALKAALLAALQARPNLATVQVTYGFPKSPAKELIMLGDIKGDQVSASLGNLSREEKYRLRVTVKVERSGVEQQPVTERAYAIAAELEDELRTNPKVGGAVRVAQIGGSTTDPGEFSLQEYAGDQSRMAVLDLDVACSARI